MASAIEETVDTFWRSKKNRKDPMPKSKSKSQTIIQYLAKQQRNLIKSQNSPNQSSEDQDMED